MNKKILLGIGLTLAAFNSYSMVNNEEICKDFNVSQLLTEMKNSKEFFAKNPFDKNCLLFLLHTTEKPALQKEDFLYAELYNEYEKLLNKQDGGFDVITLYTQKNGKFYQFFKVDEYSVFLNETKKLWSNNKNKNISLYFDDFIKLHEMAHLDFEAIKDIRHKHNAIETLADISGVVLLSFEKQFTVKETVEFLESINDIRKSKLIHRLGRNTGNNKTIKDKNGNHSSEVGHYDRKIFSNIIKDLRLIKNQEQLLQNTDLFINEKEEGIVKFIRNKYYK